MIEQLIEEGPLLRLARQAAVDALVRLIETSPSVESILRAGAQLSLAADYARKAVALATAEEVDDSPLRHSDGSLRYPEDS